MFQVSRSQVTNVWVINDDPVAGRCFLSVDDAEQVNDTEVDSFFGTSLKSAFGMTLPVKGRMWHCNGQFETCRSEFDGEAYDSASLVHVEVIEVN